MQGHASFNRTGFLPSQQIEKLHFFQLTQALVIQPCVDNWWSSNDVIFHYQDPDCYNNSPTLPYLLHDRNCKRALRHMGKPKDKPGGRSPPDTSLTSTAGSHLQIRCTPWVHMASNWTDRKCAALWEPLSCSPWGPQPCHPMKNSPCAMYWTERGERAHIASAIRLIKGIKINFPN